MAAQQSFDVTTGVDLQEVDNAVNQAVKEIRQRFDFKGQVAEIELRRDEGSLTLRASDEFHLRSMWDVLLGKLVKRKVPTKNLRPSDVEAAAGGTVRMEVTLQQGLPTDVCRRIVKIIKDRKLKKVQASIQGDQVRIASPSRDALQEVISILREQEFDLELQFTNFRSQ